MLLAWGYRRSEQVPQASREWVSGQQVAALVTVAFRRFTVLVRVFPVSQTVRFLIPWDESHPCDIYDAAHNVCPLASWFRTICSKKPWDNFCRIYCFR